MSDRSRTPSANRPYNANVNLTPEESFRANLFPMLKSEERILFHYADDLFQKDNLDYKITICFQTNYF